MLGIKHCLNEEVAVRELVVANYGLRQAGTTIFRKQPLQMLTNDVNWQEGSDRLDQTVVPSTATAGVEGTNDYGYDADNKRIWKKFTRSGSAAEHTVFIYAGPNCIAELNF